MGCGPRNVDTCAGVAVLLLRCVRGCEKPAWLAVPALRPSSRTRESAPRADRDRSPERLCIPSRAASHRLNVKIGKNVNNHEGSRKKRTSRSRTARSRTSRGREAIGREAEEAPWGVGRGGRGSPDRTDEQARSTPGTTATGWGREKRARRPKGEMETPRSGHPLVRPLVRAAFGCLARDRAGPLRLRALL